MFHYNAKIRTGYLMKWFKTIVSIPSVTYRFINVIEIFLMYFLPINFKPYFCSGEMSERFNEAVLKTVDPKGPGVRIPLSPPRSGGKLRNVDEKSRSYKDLTHRFPQFYFKTHRKTHQNVGEFFIVVIPALKNCHPIGASLPEIAVSTL